jgi:hypothetical protein
LGRNADIIWREEEEGPVVYMDSLTYFEIYSFSPKAPSMIPTNHTKASAYLCHKMM